MHGRKCNKWWRCRRIDISFRTEKFMTSDGRSKPQSVFQWSPSNSEIYYRWRRLATTWNSELWKLLFFSSRVIPYAMPYSHSPISKCRDNFKSHISIRARQQFGQYSSNHRPVHFMYETVWTNQIRPFSAKKTYFPHLNPHSWRLRQDFNIPRFRTNNSTYIRCHYLGKTRRTKVWPSQTCPI
jgi:hypothetical protein